MPAQHDWAVGRHGFGGIWGGPRQRQCGAASTGGGCHAGGKNDWGEAWSKWRGMPRSLWAHSGDGLTSSEEICRNRHHSFPVLHLIYSSDLIIYKHLNWFNLQFLPFQFCVNLCSGFERQDFLT